MKSKEYFALWDITSGRLETILIQLRRALLKEPAFQGLVDVRQINLARIEGEFRATLSLGVEGGLVEDEVLVEFLLTNERDGAKLKLVVRSENQEYWHYPTEAAKPATTTPDVLVDTLVHTPVKELFQEVSLAICRMLEQANNPDMKSKRHRIVSGLKRINVRIAGKWASKR